MAQHESSQSTAKRNNAAFFFFIKVLHYWIQMIKNSSKVDIMTQYLEQKPSITNNM